MLLLQKRLSKQVLKEAAAANRATPSGDLVSDALQGLDAHAIQAMPSPNAMQQTVNRIRKVDGAKTADLAPDKLVIVSHEVTRTGLYSLHCFSRTSSR